MTTIPRRQGSLNNLLLYSKNLPQVQPYFSSFKKYPSSFKDDVKETQLESAEKKISSLVCD
jgi:hypothetical protein